MSESSISYYELKRCISNAHIKTLTVQSTKYMPILGPYGHPTIKHGKWGPCRLKNMWSNMRFNDLNNLTFFWTNTIKWRECISYICRLTTIAWHTPYSLLVCTAWTIVSAEWGTNEPASAMKTDDGPQLATGNKKVKEKKQRNCNMPGGTRDSILARTSWI